MKNWEKAEVVSLELAETAHKWTGIYWDGGYIGDGEVSGHGTWCKNEAVKLPVCPGDPS